MRSHDNTRVRLCGLWGRDTTRGRVLSGIVTVAQLEEALAYAKGWGSATASVVVFECLYVDGKRKRPDNVLYLEQSTRRQPDQSETQGVHGGTHTDRQA